VRYSLWLITDLFANDGSTIALKLAHGISKYSFLNSILFSLSNKNDDSSVHGKFYKVAHVMI